MSCFSIFLNCSLLWVGVWQGVATPPTESPSSQDPVAGAVKEADVTAMVLDAFNSTTSSLPIIRQRFEADRQILERYYSLKLSPSRQARFRVFYSEWVKNLQKLELGDSDSESLLAYQRLIRDIHRHQAQLENEIMLCRQTRALLPFALDIIELHERRQVVERIDPATAAGRVAVIATSVELMTQRLRQVTEDHSAESDNSNADPTISQVPTAVFELPADYAKVTLQAVNDYRNILKAWYEFYQGYDPQFRWWVSHPYGEADKNLRDYGRLLRQLAREETEAETESETENQIESGDNNRRRIINNEIDLSSFDLPNLRWPQRLIMAESADWTTTWSPSREDNVDDVPDLQEIVDAAPNRMSSVISAYQNQTAGSRGRDRSNRRSRSSGQQDSNQVEQWTEALDQLPYESFSIAEQVDFQLLKNRLRHQQLLAAEGFEPGQPVTDASGISGRPIGRAALLAELQKEMIPYTPEELIEIAYQELAWCRQEMLIASRELGCGDDWKQAVEHVKTLHKMPGEQPWLVRQLSDEAVDFLREHQLLTVPPLCNETWRMQMMSEQRQLVTPFFTGGEVVSVGFPTDQMSHDAKLQSMRGNNIPFSRATVHHELIPGHGLQSFVTARYQTQRRGFSTPFWTEGWALYWEMVLYQKEFPATAEDRIGFLVWRSHRCARIVFSLSFHLGLMTPIECVDFLVENVGFERLGAEGEVRRSFGGAYPPLYQAAYMLGGLQFRNLRQELVESGKMGEQDFHDFIMTQGNLPVEMVRALILQQPLPKDFQTNWRFYQLPSEEY